MRRKVGVCVHGHIYNYIYMYIYIFRSFGLAYRNCLRASFYALSHFSRMGTAHMHCTYALHICTAQRSSGLGRDGRYTASTIEDFHSTQRPVSIAAPMLTARFSYTIAYKLALYIVRATQAHSPARGIAPARP